MQQTTDVVIGIDGGGTHTRCAVVDAQGWVQNFVISGPSNLNFTDEPTVATTLNRLINQALYTKSKERSKVRALCAGIAGSGQATNRKQIRSIFNRIAELRSATFSCETDASIAFEAAHKTRPGILLIAGTGSVCLARNEHAESFRIGGYGSFVDDAGSAYWIGYKALEQAVRQYDGREMRTALLPTLFQELKITPSSSIVETLIKLQNNRNRVAELCPIVIELAQRQDSGALHILNHAVQEYKKMVSAALARSNIKQAQDLVLTGSVFTENEIIRNMLIRLIDFEFPYVQTRILTGQPIEGAITLAAHKAHFSINEQFLKNLSQSLQQAVVRTV